MKFSQYPQKNSSRTSRDLENPPFVCKNPGSVLNIFSCCSEMIIKRPYLFTQIYLCMGATEI
jgi:hypothetical protein